MEPEEEIPTENQAERILGAVGLTMDNLKGKSVLDVGSGKRSLEKRVKEEGIDTEVISYDIDPRILAESEAEGKAVVGNVYEGLPFKSESIDLIINVGSPLRGGLWNTKVIEMYNDALRVLKKGGELRTYNPYLGYGGIALLLYYLEREGEIRVEKVDFKKFFREDEEPEFDDRGMPTPIPPGDDFWVGYFESLPKSEQIQYYLYITNEMASALSQTGLNIDLKLGEPDKEDRNYNQYLVIKKL